MKRPYLIMHSVQDYDYLWHELPLIGVEIGNSNIGSEYMSQYGPDGLRLVLHKTHNRVELSVTLESPSSDLTLTNSARHFLEYTKAFVATRAHVPEPYVPLWAR